MRTHLLISFAVLVTVGGQHAVADDQALLAADNELVAAEHRRDRSVAVHR